jgi:hypothetical protein
MAAVRRHRGTHNLAKTLRDRRYSQAWAVSHCQAGRAIDNSGRRSARTRDRFVGRLLSLVLLLLMGVCLLLLRKQLLDSWLWRCDPPIEVDMLVRGSGPTETMSKYLIRRIEQTRNVSLLTHTEIAGLEGGDHLERITWRNHEFGTTRESESLTFL